MKISINWIKDFVDLNGVDIEKLINKFTMSVAEVEGIEYKGRDILNVVTAKIIDVQEVPNSKKLHLLKIDDGEEILQVVCGAPNVRIGLITAFAKIGAKLGNIVISKAKLAGLDSFGMCCGGDEIGISEDHTGIVEFDKDTPIGVDIKNIIEIEDILFEVDNKSLTNRPDLWGHYGIAREISSLVGRPLKKLQTLCEDDFNGESEVEVIVSSKSCNRYTTAVMENITRKNSTLNTQIRLFYCGMRGINFLADITNYVMLELGQPMHAFDGDTVKKIEVFDLKEDIKFKTLDGIERNLKQNQMVIATNGTPVALAGIKGGENSEILDSTTKVLIESANFDAYKVRTTATSLGLRTEASARYEKSLDPELTLCALLRFAYLVKNQDKNAKISSKITDIYLKKYPKIEIEISRDYINNFIGIDLTEETILRTLKSLEFNLMSNKNGIYKFSVPSFRATKDINGKADLVEEITRIYGYDNITPKSIKQDVKPALLNKPIELEYNTKLCLAQRFDLNEIHSYIWYDLEANNIIDIAPPSAIRCVNSLNKDNDKIRSTIIPSLLKSVLENNKKLDNFGIFEIGRVVPNLLESNLVNEEKSLGVVLHSKEYNLKKSLLELKEILNYIFEFIFKIDLNLKKSTPKLNYYHPKNYYEIYSGNIFLGNLFCIHPLNQDKIALNSLTVGFEINFSKLCDLKQKEIKFEKISKFPTTKLDFNFLIPKNKLFCDIENIAKNIKTELNYKFSLMDIYENEDGTKSYTLHYDVNSLTRTLTNEDIETFHSQVIDDFAKNGIELKL